VGRGGEWKGYGIRRGILREGERKGMKRNIRKEGKGAGKRTPERGGSPLIFQNVAAPLY